MISKDLLAKAFKDDDITQTTSQELFSSKNMQMKTRLNKTEILHLSKILTLAKYYELTQIKDWAYEFMKLKVSEGGLGREEFVRLKNWSYGSDK